MRAVGIILGVIVFGLLAYVIWGLFGGTAQASTSNTLSNTAASNAQKPAPGKITWGRPAGVVSPDKSTNFASAGGKTFAYKFSPASGFKVKQL